MYSLRSSLLGTTHNKNGFKNKFSARKKMKEVKQLEEKEFKVAKSASREMML